MADWILGHGPAGSAAAAIEKPHGPEVDALLERRGAVFALNPKQLDRLRRPLRAFRDRFFPAGAKDDRRGALVLADSLATDRKVFREAETPPPEIIELRELSRSGSDLVAERTRLINRLKAHPGRCHPAFLKAAPDLGTDWALRLRELAPTPDKARRARKASVEAALRKSRARPARAEEILARLRGKAKCHALRSRRHKHARALRGVADRLLHVLCGMLRTGETFDPERTSRGAPK